MSHQNGEGKQPYKSRVIQEILLPLVGRAERCSLRASTVVEFDPCLVWLVDSGAATLQLDGRGVVTVEKEDILGPWLSSIKPMSLETLEEHTCELVGFAWPMIEKSLEEDATKLHLWCAFLTEVNAEFFARLVEVKTSEVIPKLTYRHYTSGETICLEGDVGREVFILTSGAASVQVKGTRVGSIKQDEVFGALAALTHGSTRTATVIATEPSDCMVFDREEFRALLRSDPQLMEKLFVDFARALHDANDAMLRANSTKWHHLF